MRGLLFELLSKQMYHVFRGPPGAWALDKCPVVPSLNAAHHSSGKIMSSILWGDWRYASQNDNYSEILCQSHAKTCCRLSSTNLEGCLTKHVHLLHVNTPVLIPHTDWTCSLMANISFDIWSPTCIVTDSPTTRNWLNHMRSGLKNNLKTYNLLTDCLKEK